MIIDAATLSLLDSANNEGYGSARLPSVRDEEIAAFVRQIDGPGPFAQAKDALGQGHGVVLSAFAERMASLAVRTGSRQSLRDGLSAAQLALAVAGDSRDSLPGLSLLFRASEILEMDPVVEFSAVAAFAAAADNQSLFDFLSRDDEDRSLAAMGYVEDRDDDGFRFERTW